MSMQEQEQERQRPPWWPGWSSALRATAQRPDLKQGWDRRRIRVVLAAVATLAASAWLVASQVQRPDETKYTPIADAYVSTAHPDTNYGTMPTLRVDATPRIRTYLRFRLDRLSGRVVKAELRLWSRTGDLVGYSVHPVASTGWGELGITSSNGPAAAEPAAASGPLGPGSWSNTDVTRLIQGKDRVSLVLTTRNRQTVSFDSREGTHRPQLVVQTEPGAGSRGIPWAE
jgi:hypothetical protein